MNIACKLRSTGTAKTMNIDELRNIVQQYTPGLPIDRMTYDELLDAICGRACPTMIYTGAQDIIDEIDVIDNIFTYRGQPITSPTITKLKSGTYGSVSRVSFSDKGQTKYFAIKKSIGERKLEEALVIEKFTAAVSCPGIISMKVRPYLGKPIAIMPLADGDLANKKLKPAQAEHIINIVAGALICMFDAGIYYLDNKLDNILYMCDGNGVSSIFLGDMGSVIPIDDDDDPPSWTATIPPPPYNNGFVPLEVLEQSALKFYNYQLSCIYCQLVSGALPPYWGKYGAEYASILTNLISATGKLNYPESKRYLGVLQRVLEDGHTDRIADLSRCLR